MLDVRVCRLSTPLGPLSVVEGPRGVVMIELRSSSRVELDARLARIFAGEQLAVRASPELPAGKELSEYFAGTRRRFTLRVDLGWLPPFARAVLAALRRVPYSELVSYGQLAARAGRPGAARAVGRVMAKNPIPIVIPCHRVVAADGTLGGFSGGLSHKRALLALEGVRPLEGGWDSVGSAAQSARPSSRRSGRPCASTTR
jgi:methylated-DNA-[protein]-cysteine S-methyltransferase